MEPLTKSLPEAEQIKITPHFCPICGVDTVIASCIESREGVRGVWYFCNCGICFQEKIPTDLSVYNAKYIASYAAVKEAKSRGEYPVRQYASLIEECTYGRMMLEVGFCTPFVLNAMKDRGWLTWAIDVNPTLTGAGNIYKGDFLTYDFSISGEAVGEKNIQRKFDLIWMGHVLEHMTDPLAAMNKAYDLLDQKGVLFITTPDIGFIQHQTIQGWDHFKADEHYILWSERALCRELERQGFNIILKRRNFSTRFNSWWDLHIIAQKRYY